MINIKVYSMTQTPLWISPMTCNIPNNNEYVEGALQRIKRNQQLIGVKIAVEYSCSKIGLIGKLQQGETLDDLYVLSEKMSGLSQNELKRYELALDGGTARDMRSLIFLADSMKNAISNMNSAPTMG